MSRQRTARASIRERANRYYHSSQLEKARALYRKICSQNKKDSEAWFCLGNINGQLGKTREAETCLRHVITLEPGHAAAYYCLGTTLREQGKLDAAVASYRQSLELNSANAEGHNNLGVVLQELGQLPEAEDCYRSALSLRPDYAAAHRNLGVIFTDLGRYAEAEIHYKAAIQISPQYTEAFISLGSLLEDMAQYGESESTYRRALQLNPRDTRILCHIATLYETQGRYQEAIGTLQKTIAVQPDAPEPHFRLALQQLRLGNLATGWPGYEWRWKTGRSASTRLPQQRWDGSAPEGKTLLVHGEQGIGDEIMFASCIPDLLAQGARVVLECDPRLVPLFQRSFPGIIAYGNPLQTDASPTTSPGRIDAQIPLGSLPGHLRPDLESFPRHEGYLQSDPHARQIWRQRFDELGAGLKVGLTWRGGNTYKERNRRSIPLEQWAPVLETPGTHFIDIQYGEHDEERQQAFSKTGVPVHHWPESDPIRNLDDFAAMLSELDLVIGIDNSTIHLAGALNTPVWVLLPHPSNWRWMLNSDTSPWYPSARLFRSSPHHKWPELVTEIADQLKRTV